MFPQASKRMKSSMLCNAEVLLWCAELSFHQPFSSNYLQHSTSALYRSKKAGEKTMTNGFIALDIGSP